VDANDAVVVTVADDAVVDFDAVTEETSSNE
jgi:hypothetical protein